MDLFNGQWTYLIFNGYCCSLVHVSVEMCPHGYERYEATHIIIIFELYYKLLTKIYPTTQLK